MLLHVHHDSLYTGGGYVSGNGSEPAQDFVRESGYQLVSVNAQYRLGLFGMLPEAGQTR